MDDEKRLPDSNDDLEELLGSALSDFQSLDLAPPASAGRGDEEESSGQRIQGLGKGMGLPELRSKSKSSKASGKGKQKSDKDSHVVEALDKLRKQTRDAVIGLESVGSPKPESLDPDAMMEDWVKQFEELAGSQGMESMVETMMQQLLSKEILHEPMKEIAERYPQWLRDHQAALPEEEYGRYLRQYNLICSLNHVYENDPSNFTSIVDLMQQMQECGQPPNDIVQELAPDLDFSSLAQLSPEITGSQPNCCVM